MKLPGSQTASFSVPASWTAVLDDAEVLRVLGVGKSQISLADVWRMLPQAARRAHRRSIRLFLREKSSAQLLLPLRLDDGTPRHISVQLSWAEGPDRLLVGDITDVTDAAAGHQAMLEAAEHHAASAVEELNHGTRNMMSMVLSLLSLSARFADDVDNYAQATMERVRALNVTQSESTGGLLRSTEGGANVDVYALVRGVFSALGAPQERVILEGAPLRVPPSRSSALALIVHELATNSSRHGALRGERGVVRISWRGDRTNMDFQWIEDGVQVSPESLAPGFGMTIVKRVAEETLGGQAAWTAESHRLVIVVSGTQR
ncbi:MAG: HWE histidine kinase domain-containing protein [Pseudomonadota bacterium]